jgi:hypothetical protein
MMATNFFLLHAPHNGCMLPMSSVPLLVKGTTWSASKAAFLVFPTRFYPTG